jgi:hypothetical protein
MKKTILTLIVFFNIFISLALANKLSKVELVDGSVIIGEVSGINNGKYTINSQEMGVLQIEESRIKQIILADTEKNPGVTTPRGYGPSSDQIEAMKNKILGDKETMGMVTSLQNDPQFQAVLNDPEIINAVKSGNTASLMNNEKLIRLKDNPIIQKITNKAEQETP